MNEVWKNLKKKIHSFINEGKNELKKINNPRDLIKQIPNLLTISRIALAPFIVANILSGNLLIAGLITGLASITDMFDGKVARALNASTNFGANLDAVVDKIFVVSITTPLFIIQPHLIIPIFLDLVIATINGYAHIQGLQTKTSKIGKVKTAFLDSLICASFFTQFKAIDTITKILYVSTILLQLKTAKEYHDKYLFAYKQIKKNELKTEKQKKIDDNARNKQKVISRGTKIDKAEKLNNLNKLRDTLMQYKAMQKNNLEKEKEKEKTKIKK